MICLRAANKQRACVSYCIMGKRGSGISASKPRHSREVGRCACMANLKQLCVHSGKRAALQAPGATAATPTCPELLRARLRLRCPHPAAGGANGCWMRVGEFPILHVAGRREGGALQFTAMCAVGGARETRGWGWVNTADNTGHTLTPRDTCSAMAATPRASAPVSVSLLQPPLASPANLPRSPSTRSSR